MKPLPAIPLLAAALLAAALLAAATAAPDSTPITAIIPQTQRVQKWHDMCGDSADPFWADDGKLYHFTCDGRGFGKEPRNLCLNRLDGEGWEDLKGVLVNPMDEYGISNDTGPDGATWKVCGQECIDGVFYAFVTRNIYGNKSKDPLMRQTSFNTSLIKSTDRGRTWTRTARENYDTPMWPGARFGAPGFIHFGRDGGQVKQDHADQFVYAISNNGFWNGGDDYILARVRRSDLPRLNAGDWSYWQSGDGLADASWSQDIARAKPILERPAKLGWTPPVFIPALNRYLLTGWHVSPTLKKWFEPGKVTYEFFESPHPWGPWTHVSSFDDHFMIGGHMYGPSLVAKYQVATGSEVEVSLITSGCPFEDEPSSLYKMWRIPLRVLNTPPPRFETVNNDHASVRYTGTWERAAKPDRRYHGGDVHFTTTPGDTVEFTFTGTEVEWIAEKFHDLGQAEVFLDDKSQGIIDLKHENFPRFVGTPVFSTRGLKPGPHTLRIVSRSAGYVVVDAFRVATAGKPVAPPPAPTKEQARWQAGDAYGFLHFGINTFTGKEWGDGSESPGLFQPTDFDSEQIVRSFKEAGLQGIILTAKHHDGFCLWPSKFTSHSVRHSPWRNGQGDVVREISKACDRQGVKFGVYLSPWDRNHADYGKPGYVDVFHHQLRELLTGYGPLFEVWFDGAAGADGRGGEGWYGGAMGSRRIDPASYYRWPEVFAMIREHQPGAHIHSDIGPDSRWGGNENGEAGDPCWATVRSNELMFPAHNQPLNLHGHRDGDLWMPAEMPWSIRCPAWFWRPGDVHKLASPARIFEVYLSSVGRGATLLMNLTPDHRGRIPEADLAAVRGFRRLREETFRRNLLDGARITASHPDGTRQELDGSVFIDGDPDTFWSAPAAGRPELVVDFPSAQDCNLFSLREHLPSGQRVDAFAIDCWRNDNWEEIAAATSVGNRRLVALPTIRTSRLRLRFDAARPPVISELGAFMRS